MKSQENGKSWKSKIVIFWKKKDKRDCFWAQKWSKWASFGKTGFFGLRQFLVFMDPYKFMQRIRKILEANVEKNSEQTDRLTDKGQFIAAQGAKSRF